MCQQVLYFCIILVITLNTALSSNSSTVLIAPTHGGMTSLSGTE